MLLPDKCFLWLSHVRRTPSYGSICLPVVSWVFVKIFG